LRSESNLEVKNVAIVRTGGVVGVAKTSQSNATRVKFGVDFVDTLSPSRRSKWYESLDLGGQCYDF
jgi:hypothetical protein